MKRSLTIVIKLGTSSIIHEKTHQPLLSLLSSIVETVVRLRSEGHKVVLVSSGAIGVGMKRMELGTRPRILAKTQALAAIGQGRLIALWDNLFGQLNQPIAQILLTRGDISDRTRYLNAVNTLSELLSMGVIPIVNENDTVSVSEIKFGDNDTLSAITSSMIHADYLFLLTDVDSLYTSNPRKDPSAKAIEVVTSVSAIRAQVSTATLGSKLGTGGMETKLIAAEIATGAGVTTIITSSKTPSDIFNIIEYVTYSSTVNTPSASGVSTPIPTDAASSVERHLPTDPTNPISPALPAIIRPARPPHTLFTPSSTPLRDLKLWTSHTLFPSGSVIIDAGAYSVLSRRESGGRLLAAGVVGVIGVFAGGQAVRIVVRRRKGAISGEAEATSVQIDVAVTSGVPLSPEAISHVATTTAQLSLLEVDAPVVPANTPVVQPVLTSSEDGEWEIVEVGRGLANYNSVEIDKVKGHKSSQISQILGYADSEHVVENITIRALA
ncbi:hypothetical protein BOTBODRAFT_63528 [Botryobasidium botryosum FD-172 SS1]|uniref:Aspartate/glutamate/uridylate kinase domain-containing protein n=1 Tax=Botryobasidium botryosum (strain FD-172 SS1) TaxID=930990 RepID=A0A067MSC2_BOTB1|nr:hypothetical protein BOTBODRAFT_63528 [Botryobasidium botryosum FD-172 SS1]